MTILQATSQKMHTYDFSKKAYSYNDARKKCQKWGGDSASGGDLASFTTEEQRIAVGEYLNKRDKNYDFKYWIGAHLDKQSKTYKWTDG